MLLTSEENAMLAGEAGVATRLAMRLVVAVGDAEDAPRLIDIEAAHVDGCLYHGQSGIDFATTLVDGGGQVMVPTTLNVTSLDMLHPELYRGEPARAEASRKLTDAYVALGCRPTWTCAPYQLPPRPGLGQQIAWAESNATVFANSVLGARTNRYGDFLDICCAITGKAPHTGLHTDEGRAGEIGFELDVPERALESDAMYPLLGYLVGELSGTRVPVIKGLDDRATEDRLKALGAAAASSGAVGMFHAVGVTPEAPDARSAFGGGSVPEWVRLGVEDLHRARSQLTGRADRLGAVSVGTPHMSTEEMAELAEMVEGSRTRVPFYVNTAREVLQSAQSSAAKIGEFGATIVTDTCTYITPVMDEVSGAVMTNSAKWAHYAPANLGLDVVFGSLAECVASARQGDIVMLGEWS